MEGPPAERLTKDSKGELVEVVTEAFAQHPMIPALGGTTQDTGALVRALVNFHWSMKSLLLCGVRTEAGLVCVSLSVDARADASLWSLARLAWAVSRTVGRGAIGPLLDVQRYKPLLKARHLEMVILATFPTAQRQGLGRRLLQFLYRQALREGYEGILLLADRDTPAFHLYRSEGFEIERRFEAAGQDLCWMRRAV